MKGLTIVIPVYNVKDYLTACLDSLPSDVYVILVNDGSTDGSDIICRRYATVHPNVRLINKSNGGLSDARNAAYPFISTDYVFFLDSDDYIDADNLSRAYEFAISANLDWVQCGYVYDYPDYILKPTKFSAPCQICKEDALIQLISNSYIKNFAWGKIYKSAVVKKFLFPKGKFYEDALWQYRVLEQSNHIGVFPSTVMYYRQRSESISGQFSVRSLDLLDGLRDRLQAIAYGFPELLGMAALNLWKLSREYVMLARACGDKALAESFEKFYSTLLSEYSEHIRSGIDSEDLFNHICHIMEFKGWRCCGIINLIHRLADRLSPSDYTKIIKDA